MTTDSLIIEGNVFTDVGEGLVTPGSMIHIPEGTDIHFFDKNPELPKRLEDGVFSVLSAAMPRGREFIIVNEWGPYNFQYPNLVLRNREVVGEREILTFAVFGPDGSWSVKSMDCYNPITATTGTCPDTLVVYRQRTCHPAKLILEYTGEAFTDQFGNIVDQGAAYKLSYVDTEIRPTWDVVYFQYDSSSDPITHPDRFSLILAGEPRKSERHGNLAFRWWREPAVGISEDHFAVRASTDIHTAEGKYLFQVESDDGIRLWVDGELILERWDIHEPIVDEVIVSLSEGAHHVGIEYFEATGLAVLDVIVKAVSF